MSVCVCLRVGVKRYVWVRVCVNFHLFVCVCIHFTMMVQITITSIHGNCVCANVHSSLTSTVATCLREHSYYNQWRERREVKHKDRQGAVGKRPITATTRLRPITATGTRGGRYSHNGEIKQTKHRKASTTWFLFTFSMASNRLEPSAN